jgi:large subunit ribosomal protein L3
MLHSLQIGASNRPERTTNKQQLGHFRKAGVPPKFKLQEFRVTEDAVLDVGTELSAGHFVPGQYVDVTATS